MLLTLTIASAALIAASVFAIVRAVQKFKQLLGRLASAENDLLELSRDLDSATVRANDQARRIAWLETRVRPARTIVSAAPSNIIESAPAQPSKPNITERRHRVLTLVRRGQTAGAIASTLNMTVGEVELIIGLSRAA